MLLANLNLSSKDYNDLEQETLANKKYYEEEALKSKAKTLSN